MPDGRDRRPWTGRQAWLLGARLYLPEAWLTPAERARARVPTTATLIPKWQMALTLLRQVRAARITVTAVVGDAECGDNATLRRTWHRARLPYALGVSSDLKVFLGTPRLQPPPASAGRGRPRTRPTLATDTRAVEARAWGAAQPPGTWRLISWRNGTNAACGHTHLTLPRVRAVVQEVLTARFFMTQPHYLTWMLQLKDVELRN